MEQHLGIPCIGYEGLDTQEKCHPDLTVKLGDLATAKKLLTKIKSDKQWYNKCSQIAKEQYYQHYHESTFLNKFYEKS